MPVNIHGKEYRTVAERIDLIHKQYDGNVSITTEIEQLGEERVVIKATIVSGEHTWTGHALEVFGSSMINKTSALENAETSAIGRALAFAGLGGEEIASADEVANAISQQKDMTSSRSDAGSEPAATNSSTDSEPFEWSDEKRNGAIGWGKHKGTKWTEIPEGYLRWITDNSDNDTWKTMAHAEIIARAGERAQKDDAETDENDRRDTINVMMTKLINKHGMDSFKAFASPKIGERKPSELSLEQYEKLYSEYSDHCANVEPDLKRNIAESELAQVDRRNELIRKTNDSDPELPF